MGCIPGWEDGPCGCTSPVGTSRTPQLSSPSLGLGLRAHQPLATLVAWAAPVCTCPGDAGPTRTLQGQERTLASESQGPALQEPPAGPGDPQTQPTGHSQTHIHTHITREYRSHVHTDHTCTHHTRPSPHPHVTCSHTSQGAHHMYTPITHACTRYACTRGGDTVGTPAPGCSQGLCHAHRDATTMEKPLTQGRGPVRAERHGPHLPFALPLAHTTPECHPDSCSAPHSPSGQAGAHRTSWLQGGPWESGKHGPHFWPRAPGAGGVGARWQWGTGSH